MIYIEHFETESCYQPEVFFRRISKTVDYDRQWPLLCVGSYHREDLWAKFFADLNAGKSRTRPSYCLDGVFESVERVIGHSLGMCGQVSIVTAACASTAYAMFQAHALSVVCGTPVIVASATRMMEGGFTRFWFRSLGAIDQSTGIPFDRNSKGFASGEAMTFFIVSAKPIKPIAYIETLRFFSLTEQSTNVGSIELIRQQLFNNLNVGDVCWWSAHAPGTPVGDAAEYEIFSSVIGDRDIPISSFKGLYGHTITSCFNFELAKGLESLRGGVIPCNVELTSPINDDPRIIVEPVRTTGTKFLKFNMGFGGKNVVAIVGLM